MNISLIITTYPPHFKYLNDLIKNIDHSTLLPSEVIIAVSEYNDTFPCIQSNILNIKLLPVHCKQNAAENRNRAIRIATGEYICIVDGDDFIHVKKLEICRKIFESDSKVTFLVHNYDTFTTNWDYNKNIDDTHTKLHECFINSGCCNIMTNNDHPIHHAHVFFKKNLFNEIQYKEDELSYRKEDGIFCQDILNRFGNVYMIDLPLVGYRQ
jgi:glycosyltransferase involved in cell wall biosynthesis